MNIEEERKQFLFLVTFNNLIVITRGRRIWTLILFHKRKKQRKRATRLLAKKRANSSCPLFLKLEVRLSNCRDFKVKRKIIFHSSLWLILAILEHNISYDFWFHEKEKERENLEFKTMKDSKFVFFYLHFLRIQIEFKDKQLGKDKMITSNKIEVHTPKKLFLPSL